MPVFVNDAVVGSVGVIGTALTGVTSSVGQCLLLLQQQLSAAAAKSTARG